MSRDSGECGDDSVGGDAEVPMRATVRGSHHGGIFPKARTRPPLSLSRLNRWLALALRAEAARCLGDRTFTDEQFFLYEDWARRSWALARGKPLPGGTLDALWQEHRDVLHVFWLLDLGRMLPFFGSTPWETFSMFAAYEWRHVYPVVLPMWDPIDRRMPLPELCWRDWGPFAGHAYTAAFLGNGTQCAVLDHLGVALYRPEMIFNERQRRFLSDLVNDMRNVISNRENLHTEPDFGGVPDWVTDTKIARTFYAHLRRAAAQVWAYHRAHRRCACGARLARARGGNPGATCDAPTCRTDYESRRKRVQRIVARLAAVHRDKGFMMTKA